MTVCPPRQNSKNIVCDKDNGNVCALFCSGQGAEGFMLKCLCIVICERRSQDRVFNQAAKASGTTPEMIHTDRGAAYTSTNYNEALRQEKVRHSLSAPGTPADNAVMEHWWADFKSIWLEHRPKAQTLAELQEQVRAGIMYFTNQFISAKRNDQTVAEYYHDLVG